MMQILGCIATQHDWQLVLVAAVVCIIYSFASIELMTRARDAQLAIRWRWALSGAVATGLGIWATHFIGMLAYEYQWSQGLDAGLTFASAIVGIVGAAIAYWANLRLPSLSGPIVAGLALACGTSLLHYLGMFAYTTGAMLVWQPDYIVLSVSLSILFSVLAMVAWYKGAPKALAAALLVAEIVLLHFTGMTALTVIPTVADVTATLITREAVETSVIAVALVSALVGYLVLRFDNQMTRQKAREADQLKVMAKRLEDALHRAEASNRAKGDFLANISHEMRTPMNGILGMAQVMKTTELTDQQKRYIEVLEGAGNALMVVINDVLDFSKLEAKRVKLEEAPFDIRAMVTEIIAKYRDSAAAKGLKITHEIDNELPPYFDGDALRVRQILSHLIKNAVKFTMHGEVSIRVLSIKSGVRLEVVDTGMGIEESVRCRIFEKFEQADTSRSRQFDGTGLGLSLCYELATLMNGTIDVSSVVGEGSTFWVDLPLKKTSRTPEQGAAKSKVPPPMAPAASKVEVASSADAAADEHEQAPYILVAEDNAVNQQVIKTLLRSCPYEVVLVDNGQKAVEMFAERRPALIIMDVAMPVMDGHAATRAIRHLEAQRRAKPVPIVAATAHVLAQDREACFQAGMDDFMTKPLNRDLIKDMVERWAGPTEARAA
ncbi:ATP-binding protein [Parvularcula sp. LCG005]|uniref:hybrid sensor histidine kinase/response regulator n=1 Tax=Parvularcula sp. LCG005 TaxID=3078805 RepID=UPI0029421EEE|nr:ATP-binding protein [Parvularcula sp. LCG005]WOI53717.1 ATP-binding protein [Parvularcula sp. LCG005]